MADIKIRNIGNDVVAKIDDLAEARNLSREEYLRRYLTQMAVRNEVVALEDKYISLIDSLSDVIKMNTDVMEQILHFINS